MTRNILIILGLLVLVTIVIAVVRARGSDEARPNMDSQSPYVTISQHQYAVEVALSVDAQAKGLSGRDELKKGSGMLFVYSEPMIQAFWMKGMRFPIDIVWINNDTVIGITENALVDPSIIPKIYSSPGKVNFVLELSAGTAGQNGLRAGDKVVFSGI